LKKYKIFGYGTIVYFTHLQDFHHAINNKNEPAVFLLENPPDDFRFCKMPVEVITAILLYEHLVIHEAYSL
jgi:hypothetical protein